MREALSPPGYVERILEGRVQFEKDCETWFAEARDSGAPFLIVANDTFDDPGESHYPIPVKDAESFWGLFGEHDGHHMQQILRVFRTDAAAPDFREQFQTDHKVVKNDPVGFGFPPLRSDGKRDEDITPAPRL